MATILQDSVATDVVHMRPQAKQIAIVTIRKSTHGFPLLSYMSVGLRLAAL